MTESQTAAPAKDYEHDHGNSVAAWTGVVLMMVGFLIASIGVGMTSVVVTVVGFVVVALGGVAWKVLSAMGVGGGTH